MAQAKFDAKKEALKFVEDLEAGKEKVETSKNFELDYMRQYAKSDRAYIQYALSLSFQKKD
ncbi:MAG: hypothetical protein K2N14_01200 [Clostridia bacterium]|nr:hypothetical protein [Clostridia bacterium]